MLGYAPRGGTARPAIAVRRLTVAKGAMLASALVVATMFTLPGGEAGAGPTAPVVAQATARAPLASLNRVPSATTAAHGAVFLSPSRNIGCEVNFRFAHLGAATFCQTLAPPQSATITTTGAVQKCAGATCVGHPAQNTPILQYMTATSAGPFLCASRFDGVACSVGNRGFLISRSGIVTYPVVPHTTMAIYTDPAGNRELTVAKAFGWVVAVDRPGHDAEVAVECGHGTTGNLPRDDLWTVDLSAISSFQAETNLANPAAGSVIGVTHDKWVNSVRVHGWDGYLYLGGKHSYVSNGPGSSACP